MPRALQLLLLASALAAPLCATAAAQGERREEIQTLTQAVAGEKKKDPEAWYRLGIEYNRAGDVGRARAAFTRALKLRPDYAAARAGLAYTFFVEKKYDEAERAAYRASTFIGDRSGFVAYNVLAAVRSQRFRETALRALANAEEALAKNPDAPDWNLLKADALIVLSIPEQQIPPDLSFPDAPPPLDKAAREEARRRDKEAADCLEKYLSLARSVPDEAFLRNQLEGLRYYAQGPEAADRAYLLAEVSTKAVVRSKPEPGFTDEARNANVVGTVRLRATLAPDGKVKHLLVVIPLGHGLTEQAMRAARDIRFTPATLDGAPVPQQVVLEYNFSVY